MADITQVQALVEGLHTHTQAVIGDKGYDVWLISPCLSMVALSRLSDYVLPLLPAHRLLGNCLVLCINYCRHIVLLLSRTNGMACARQE